MARPREINPTGKVRRIAANIPEQVARDIEREAKRRGVSIARVIRERLGAA